MAALIYGYALSRQQEAKINIRIFNRKHIPQSMDVHSQQLELNMTNEKYASVNRIIPKYSLECHTIYIASISYFKN
jgi:hypothetical protein